MTTVECEMCAGQGEYQTHSFDHLGTQGSDWVECDFCEGKGVIEIPETEEESDEDQGRALPESILCDDQAIPGTRSSETEAGHERDAQDLQEGLQA